MKRLDDLLARAAIIDSDFAADLSVVFADIESMMDHSSSEGEQMAECIKLQRRRIRMLNSALLENK